MKIDMTTESFDWDQIPTEIRKLKQYMDDSFPKTDEDWDEFVDKNITIGFGDHVLIIPVCAASFNYLHYCLNDMADEFEA